MTRTSSIVTLAILASILTPVVVKATGATPEKSAAVREAKVETTGSTTAAPTGQPACVRRVKVVYAGYGEAHAAACATTAEIRR